MGQMKYQTEDINSLKMEIDHLKMEIELLNSKLNYYKNALIEIVQMERYPRESGSSVYDGIYPTGAFAVKVLKGEKKDG